MWTPTSASLKKAKSRRVFSVSSCCWRGSACWVAGGSGLSSASRAANASSCTTRPAPVGHTARGCPVVPAHPEVRLAPVCRDALALDVILAWSPRRHRPLPCTGWCNRRRRPRAGPGFSRLRRRPDATRRRLRPPTPATCRRHRRSVRNDRNVHRQGRNEGLHRVAPASRARAAVARCSEGNTRHK